jgi:hypothetical protein
MALFLHFDYRNENNLYFCNANTNETTNATTKEMESNNVRHTTVKPVGEKMVELLDRLQQRKKENLEELSAKMSYFFPAQ